MIYKPTLSVAATAGVITVLSTTTTPTASVTTFWRGVQEEESYHFRHIRGGLNDEPSLPFQPEWINDFANAPYPLSNHDAMEPPSSLDAPDFVPVFHLSNISTTLEELGKEARRILDEVLPRSSGAILFRNLHSVISDPSDFATFWNAAVDAEISPDWEALDHLSCYNRKRQRLDGGGETSASSRGRVDRVDTDVPWMTIGPHNEHACNVQPTAKIAFYSLTSAPQGGETLLRRNSDIVVPFAISTFMQQHGGLRFERVYPDQAVLGAHRDQFHPTAMSWQERTNSTTRQGARDYFHQRGITNVTFDETDASLRAVNHHDGLLTLSDQKLWFNHLDYGLAMTCADGAPFPPEYQSYLKQRKWHETFAFKLQRGDWIVMDNFRVQHGRLPYQDTAEQRRKLIVTYTAPSSDSEVKTRTLTNL